MLGPVDGSAVNGFSTKGSALRISIDSTEPLEDAIRVLGAAYNVTLTVATTHEGSTTAPAVTARGRRSRPAAGNGARTRASGRDRPGQRVAKVSNEVLRSWARENGHTVSDRGRVPKNVVAAYRDAQSS
jgi:hypothetical protein